MQQGEVGIQQMDQTLAAGVCDVMWGELHVQGRQRGGCLVRRPWVHEASTVMQVVQRVHERES